MRPLIFRARLREQWKSSLRNFLLWKELGLLRV
jgi:hypothetical protein